MGRNRRSLADRLTPADRARLAAEYRALPRLPSGRVELGYRTALCQKWGLSDAALWKVLRGEEKRNP